MTRVIPLVDLRAQFERQSRYLLEAWGGLDHRPGDFPAPSTSAEVFPLPLYAELTSDGVRFIADVVPGSRAHDREQRVRVAP